MKPAKIRSLSPIMERHTPQHPLPDEIKELPQDATVCQFCGVSYLIHHEIKKLEDLVAQLQDELEDHRGAVEREKTLKFELEKHKSAIELMNMVIAEKDSTIDKITKAVEEAKSTNDKLSNELNKEKKENEKAKLNMKSYQNHLKEKILNFQHEASSIKSDLNKLKCDVVSNQTESSSMITKINEKLPDFANACVKEFSSISATTTDLTVNFQSLESDLEYWKAKALKADEDFKILQHNLEATKTKNNNSEDEMRKKLEELEMINKDQAQALKISEMRLTATQADSVQIEEKLRKKTFELQSAAVKLEKCEENATRTIQRLNEDCRQLEKELVFSKEETKKMRLEQKERERKDQELSRRATLNSNQINEMETTLAEAKATVKSLMDERELMVSSHQNQIQQLRENFKKNLEASEGHPVRAQKELQLAEEKYREALASLEHSLKEEFRIELSVEKDKYSEGILDLAGKHRNELRTLETNLRNEMETLKQENATLLQKVGMLNKSIQEKAEDFETERKSLKKMVGCLEERITQLTGEQEDNTALGKIQVVAMNDKVAEAEKRNEDLEKKVISMKEEITLLQDTVRRECEERFELTEALSQAREHFKSCKMSNATLSQQSNPAYPVSAVNKLNPITSDIEQNRLSSRTLRNLEIESAPRAGHNLPSLRSLPDLSRRDYVNNHKTSPSPPSDAPPQVNVSPHLREVSFGGVDGSPKRSLSGGAHVNGVSRTAAHPNTGTILPMQVKSADSVDTVRRRIAAAIKRK